MANADSSLGGQPSQCAARADHDRAVVCLLLNLVVFPGLGTILAKRVISGILQMMLALSGLVLACAWLYKAILVYVASIRHGSGTEPPTWRMALIALGFLMVSWVWSTASGIVLLRDARGHASISTTAVPQGSGATNPAADRSEKDGACPG